MNGKIGGVEVYKVIWVVVAALIYAAYDLGTKRFVEPQVQIDTLEVHVAPIVDELKAIRQNQDAFESQQLRILDRLDGAVDRIDTNLIEHRRLVEPRNGP